SLLCKAIHAPIGTCVTKRRLSEGDGYPSELNPRPAFGFFASSVTSLRMASRAVCVAIAASLHALARSLADRRASASVLSFLVLGRSRRTNNLSRCSSTSADKKSSTETASLREWGPGKALGRPGFRALFIVLAGRQWPPLFSSRSHRFPRPIAGSAGTTHLG